MTIVEQKMTILEKVMQVEDETLLDALKSLLDFGLKRQNRPVADFWNDLSESQKARIERSIQQLDAGEGIPHEAVMNEFRQKYRP